MYRRFPNVHSGKHKCIQTTGYLKLEIDFVVSSGTQSVLKINKKKSSWTAATILPDSLDGSCFEPPTTRLNKYQNNIYWVIKASSPKEWQKKWNHLFELNF